MQGSFRKEGRRSICSLRLRGCELLWNRGISLGWKWGLGQTYALAGRRDEALAVAAELENQPSVWDTWGLAEIYTALGDKDKAFHYLEEAYEQRHAYIQWLTGNQNFDPLKDDARYTDLVKRLNLMDED